MSKQRAIRATAFLALLVSLILGACAPVASPPQATSTTISQATSPSQTIQPPVQPVTLKIAMLPILDALPFYVAQQKGYFDAQGLKVEFIAVSSAAERDQIMAAGQADGMINDLVSTLLYNKDGVQIQIVRFARTATPQFPQYRILSAPRSNITIPSDLKGVPIGISEASVIAYVTDRLLTAEGLKPEDIKTIAVPKISDRLALLANGELKAATLPDPLSDLAIQGGATVVLDDTKHPEYGNSVVSFRKAVIDAHPEAIRGFLAALEQASKDVNAAPQQWTDLLTQQQLVPAPLLGNYSVPPFPSASIPSEGQWADVVAWAKDKNLINADVSYSESVNPAFLP